MEPSPINTAAIPNLFNIPHNTKVTRTVTYTFQDGTTHTTKGPVTPGRAIASLSDCFPQGTIHCLQSREAESTSDQPAYHLNLTFALKANGCSTESIIKLLCTQNALCQALTLTEEFLNPSNAEQLTKYLKATAQSREQLLNTFMPEFWQRLFELINKATRAQGSLNQLRLSEKTRKIPAQRELASKLNNIAIRLRNLFQREEYAKESAQALNKTYKLIYPNLKIEGNYQGIEGIAKSFHVETAEETKPSEDLIERYTALAKDCLSGTQDQAVLESFLKLLA
tara:strand:+ start:35582 stop:36427 length:846 start_codon:yes stop_codon:yes gene_type:complete